MVELTAAHWVYLLGILTVLVTMALRKETPLVCIVSAIVPSEIGVLSSAPAIWVRTAVSSPMPNVRQNARRVRVAARPSACQIRRFSSISDGTAR